MKVLLVDDTPSILKISTRILARAGFKVTTAENGLLALQELVTGHFEVVLMDLHMPVLDGLETVKRIRAMETTANVGAGAVGGARQFIIAVSANSDPDIIQEALQSGYDAFLEKPFSLKDFQALFAARELIFRG